MMSRDSSIREQAIKRHKTSSFESSSSGLWWCHTPAILLAGECHVTARATSPSRDVLYINRRVQRSLEETV